MQNFPIQQIHSSVPVHFNILLIYIFRFPYFEMSHFMFHPLYTLRSCVVFCLFRERLNVITLQSGPTSVFSNVPNIICNVRHIYKAGLIENWSSNLGSWKPQWLFGWKWVFIAKSSVDRSIEIVKIANISEELTFFSFKVAILLNPYECISYFY